MLISTKGRYALSVMVALSRMERGTFVPLKVIAQEQGISLKYLEAILKSLCLAGFTEGVRGKYGGYRLLRNPEDISVYDVIDVAENGIVAVTSLTDSHDICKNEEGFMWMWQELEDKIEIYLKSVSIKDLSSREEQEKKDA